MFDKIYTSFEEMPPPVQVVFGSIQFALETQGTVLNGNVVIAISAFMETSKYPFKNNQELFALIGKAVDIFNLVITPKVDISEQELNSFTPQALEALQKVQQIREGRGH